MLPSRGMGAVSPSKMPKGKKIRRKDYPDQVEVYARGGVTPPTKRKVDRK